MSGIKEAVAEAGSMTALGEMLGVTQQAVSLWVAQGYVPLARAKQIASFTRIPEARLVSPEIAELLGASRAPAR